VIAEGSQYSFFVNDQLVGEVIDDEWTAGSIKLFIQLCEPDDSAVIEFDNMEVRVP